MKAMILAAGLGERMRPLTDRTPKPLLQVAGRPLIDYHLAGLAGAGVREVVINVSHLAEQVRDYCGDGSRWGLRIAYSPEDSPLETAGGILNALPLLGEQPFLVVNGDIWADIAFAPLLARELPADVDAHLVLVDNPPQHPLGDFVLDGQGRLAYRDAAEAGLTYAGVGIYAPSLLRGLTPGKTPLRPLLDRAIGEQRLSGEYHGGAWHDIGTPERLAELDAALRA